MYVIFFTVCSPNQQVVKPRGERLQRVTPDIHPRLYLTCGNIIPRAEALVLLLRVGGERGPVTKRNTAECRHESLTGVMEAKAVCVCVFISPLKPFPSMPLRRLLPEF